MDFGKLLSVAKRNTSVGGQNGEGRYYSTKFAPPKKESKEKKLSENIKKFLAKKEEEERAKALEARRKTEELMAKRDVKAKKKIEKMLKVIKSANKSVLDDATDAQSSAMALAGPEQPDEDDYGYTSNVASQFYQQLMDKYKSNPEEQKFKEAERRTMSKEDLARTKARVKDAIMRQTEEESGPRSRKSRSAGGGHDERDGGSRCLRGPDPYDPAEEQRHREAEAARAKAEEKKKQQARRGSGAPPPPDFATLLKLAEQKQKEPVRLELDAAPEKRRTEPERLMTKREKKEHEERMAFFEMKRLRDRIKDDPKLSDKEKQQRLAKLDAMRASGKLPGIPASSGGEGGARTHASPASSVMKPAPTSSVVSSTAKPSSLPGRPAIGSAGSGANGTVGKPNELGKIKKLSDAGSDQPTKKSASGESRGTATAGSATSSMQSPRAKLQPSPSIKASHNGSTHERQSISSSSLSSPASSKSSIRSISRDSLSNGHSQRSKGSTASEHSYPPKSTSSVSSSTTSTSAKPSVQSRQPSSARPASSSGSLGGSAKREAPEPMKNGARPHAPARPTLSGASSGSAKRPPAAETVTQTRQFPPPDVQRSMKRPSMPQNGTQQRRPPGQTVAVKKRRVIDSDSEYDSEMDDFIDDGDCEEDYSSAIKEIFGYDKSRYRDEHYEDDDYNMESTYAQQMREEYISKKIGIMEDLEDMRMEEEEKRRKLGKKVGPAAKRK